MFYMYLSIYLMKYLYMELFDMVSTYIHTYMANVRINKLNGFSALKFISIKPKGVVTCPWAFITGKYRLGCCF